MSQPMKYFKQMSLLFLFIGIGACTGIDSGALKEKVERMRAEISDEITALKSVRMEQQGVLDGLRKDLKWEYTEELDKIVSRYDSEVAALKRHAAELDELYDRVAGIEEKLGGAPLEYNQKLMEEMLEEDREKFEELAAENEAVQERLLDLSDRAGNE